MLKIAIKIVRELSKWVFCLEQYGKRDDCDANVAKVNSLYNTATTGLSKAALLDIKKAYDRVQLSILTELSNKMPDKGLVTLLLAIKRMHAYLNMVVL